MDRHRLCFLAHLLASLSALGACTEYQTLPVQLYVDEDFTIVEQQAITDAIDLWNQRAGARYIGGEFVLEIVGTHTDDFNEHDYEDRQHRIYRINEPLPDEQYLQEIYNNIGVYATLSDAFLVMYTLDHMLAQQYQSYLEGVAAGRVIPFDIQRQQNQLRYGVVHNLILHELGHMLGLLHINTRPAVMNSNGLNVYSGIETLTDADLDAFCLIYHCYSIDD